MCVCVCVCVCVCIALYWTKHCLKKNHFCCSSINLINLLQLEFNIIKKHNNDKKKHSENADTSTSMTFDLDVWPWPYSKVKKVYVIICRLLYRVLVPGLMSVNVIVCEIWPLILSLLPLTFTCDLHRPSRSLSFLSLDGRYIVVYWFQVRSL